MNQAWKFSDVVLVVEGEKLHVPSCACLVFPRFREDVYVRISGKGEERNFPSR